ncbi:hypothetical protein [Nocardia brasiliensis]
MTDNIAEVIELPTGSSAARRRRDATPPRLPVSESSGVFTTMRARAAGAITVAGTRITGRYDIDEFGYDRQLCAETIGIAEE